MKASITSFRNLRYHTDNMDSIEYLNFYAVLEFRDELKLGISDTPQWSNTDTYKFSSFNEANNALSNSKCDVAILLGADSADELIQDIRQTQQDFNDPDWVNQNISPFL